jgi:hypothetical protein
MSSTASPQAAGSTANPPQPSAAEIAMREQQRNVERVAFAAADLLRLAERLGVTVRIDVEPLQPFAMGHHRQVIDVWTARHPRS